MYEENQPYLTQARFSSSKFIWKICILFATMFVNGEQTQLKLLKPCGRPEEDKPCEKLTKMDPSNHLYRRRTIIELIIETFE